MTVEEVVPWACPFCHRALQGDPERLGPCDGCGRSFPFLDGIPDFVGAERSDFYETMGTTHNFSLDPGASAAWRTRLALFFGDDDQSTTFRFLRRVVREPGTVLDVGCGGGNGYYPRVGPTVGVDLAVARLTTAASRYRQVARAAADRLPFPEGCVSYVVSTDLLEHVAPEAKDRALAEMARVLKPGGRMVHVFPIDGPHPLVTWAKGFPDLYERYFIDLDGHEGLEPLERTLDRLSRVGLRVVDVSACRGVVWSKWEVLKRLGNEYVSTAWWMRGLVAAARLMTRSRYLNHLANVPLTLADGLLTRLVGVRYAYRIGVCAEKPYGT